VEDDENPEGHITNSLYLSLFLYVYGVRVGG